MLLHILFIFFLFLNSIKSQTSTTGIFQTTETVTTAKASTVTEIQPGVQLLASPDYPVSEGQRVQLQCKLLSGSTVSVDWTWQVLKGQTWKEVDSDGELILTKPEQSGVYRCLAGSNWSQNHTVSIVAIRASTVQHMSASYSWKRFGVKCQRCAAPLWGADQRSEQCMSRYVGEVLGIAAFVLSLLVLITIIAGLLLVVYQRIGIPKTPSSPAVKEKDPGPKFEPKGDFPTEDGDGDYMNYTGKNSAYTDLDPSSLSADNEYSTV